MKDIINDKNINFRKLILSEIKRNSTKIKMKLFFYTLIASIIIIPCVEAATSNISNTTGILESLAGPNALLLNKLITSFPASPFAAASMLGIGEKVSSINGLALPTSQLSTTPILVITTLLALLSYFSLTFEKVNVVGPVLSEMESRVGQIFAFVGPLFVPIAATGAIAYATTGSVGDTSGIPLIASTYYISIIISFIIAIVFSIVFYIIKTVVFFLNILEYLFFPIPGSSFIFATLKNGLVGLNLYINTVNPVVGFTINIFIIILSCFIFKKAYITVTYFRHIYIKPLTGKLNPFKKKDLSLICKKLPKKISNFNKEKEIKLAIPIFPIKKFKYIKHLWVKQKCWLLSLDNENYIYKNRLFKKPMFVKINDVCNKDVIIRRRWFYYEFYEECETEKNRQFEFVISRDYSSVLNEIIEVTRFKDYKQIDKDKDIIKSNKRKWFCFWKKKDKICKTSN